MRIVFDLDGTLTDDSHRKYLITGEGPKRWDEFFERCDADLPMRHAIAVFWALRNDGHFIEIFSARGRGEDDSVALKTLAWLDEHIGGEFQLAKDDKAGFFANRGERVQPWTPPIRGFQGPIIVRMRAHGDYTHDQDLKREWLNCARAEGVDPHLVFDDRQRVVDMWREEGVPCFQVAPGNF